MSESGTKRGVSLYSFTQELRSGSHTMEDCFAAVQEMEVKGIEIVNPMHLPNFPYTSTEDLRKIRKGAEKYGLKIVCAGAYVDTALKTGAKLTREEMVAQTVRDLEFANELEAPIMRVSPWAPAEAILPALPTAERYNVKLGVEIHPPYTALCPSEGVTLERLKELNSPFYGVIPDFAAFANMIPKRITNSIVQELGVPSGVMDLLVGAIEAGASVESLKERAASMGAPPEFDDLIELLWHLIVRAGPDDLAALKGYIVHCHGKYYDIDENGEEPSISYPALLRTLEEIGFDGYVVSEYEGWALDKEPRGVEMVRRHQELMRRCLGR